MKRQIFTGTVLGIALLGSITLAQAGVNRRQFHQDTRIGRGVSTGELTRPEYARLERSQNRIQRNEARARFDGDFTRAERARINNQLNRQSRHIYLQKHDRQDRD